MKLIDGGKEKRARRTFATAGVLALALIRLVAGQTSTSWTPPRTPWGHPDLQGAWSGEDMSGVPVQRLPTFGARNLLTDEELEARLSRLRQRPPTNNVEAIAPLFQPDVPLNPSRQASQIIDPRDGQLPALSADGERRASELLESRRGRGNADSFQDRNVSERCLANTIFGTMVPMNRVYIVQSPQYVAILNEVNHETHVVGLDGRPHVAASIRTYIGDSRGRWDGDTLVIETTNLMGRPTLDFRVGPLTTTSQRATITERLKLLDARTLWYEAIVDDGGTWSRPWTVAFPRKRDAESQIFESGCHEGNYALRNVLSGARAEDAAADGRLR